MEEMEGSWWPTAVLVIVLLSCWIKYGSGRMAVGLRRTMNIQRLHWKKRLGFRDDSKYKMTAGDGANQKYKRQG